MSDVDVTDLAILRLLREDSTQSAGAVGRRVGVSQPNAWRRIKRLRDAGIIAGETVEFDLAALGFGVTVFLGIKLATRGRVSLDEFERAISAIPEVQTVEHVLGLYDYRVRVAGSNKFWSFLHYRTQMRTFAAKVTDENVLKKLKQKPA